MKTHNLLLSVNDSHREALMQKIKLLMPEFVKLIQIRLGIFIHEHQKMEVERIIAKVCSTLDLEPFEYLAELQNARDDAPSLVMLVSGITIGETYFFRDKRQMELLEQRLLPRIIKSKRESNDLSLRIWSAGCSSGEEIYTVAILLNELLPDINSWRLHLLGTDINTVMIKKAITAHYGEWSMRSIPEKYKQQYFMAEKNGYTLLNTIRNRVEFDYLNLNDDTWPSMLNGTNALDLIVCRNVLIYFDNESALRLMRKMGSSLIDGGYLLLGASDPVNIKTADLIFHHEEGLLFSRPTVAERMAAVPKKMDMSVKKKPDHVTPKLEKIQPSKEEHKKKIPLHPGRDVIQKMLGESKWQELVELTDSLEKNPQKMDFLTNARVTALTSLGKLEQAVVFCNKNIPHDPDNIYLRLMLAMALVELNRLSDAEAELRKILFIDHQYVMGHYQLGLLLFRNKDHAAGLKSLQNAAKIVGSRKSSEPVPGCEGLDYGHLADILAREIEIHASPLEMKGYDNQKSKQ